MRLYSVMKPAISVIITCYNFEHVIQRTVQSVLEQSFSDIEIIIIDDASHDNSPKIISKLAKEDERIIPILHTKNNGISYVLSQGLDIAKGEYVAILDGDDIWLNLDKLKRQYQFLETHTDYVLVGTGVVHKNEFGKVLFRSSEVTSDKDLRTTMLKKNNFGHSTLLFRKDSAKRVGGYPNCTLNQDYELCLKLGTVGKIANLPSFDVQHSITGENQMFKKHITLYIGRLQLVWQYRKKYPKWFGGMVHTILEFIVHYIPKGLKEKIKKIINVT